MHAIVWSSSVDRAARRFVESDKKRSGALEVKAAADLMGLHFNEKTYDRLGEDCWGTTIAQRAPCIKPMQKPCSAARSAGAVRRFDSRR